METTYMVMQFKDWDKAIDFALDSEYYQHMLIKEEKYFDSNGLATVYTLYLPIADMLNISCNQIDIEIEKLVRDSMAAGGFRYLEMTIGELVVDGIFKQILTAKTLNEVNYALMFAYCCLDSQHLEIVIDFAKLFVQNNKLTFHATF